MADPRTPTKPSHWLGAAWGDGVLDLNPVVDAEDAATRSCQPTPPLRADSLWKAI